MCFDPDSEWARGGRIKKKLAGLVLAASLVAAIPMSPAQANEDGCTPLVPNGVVCLTTCLAWWVKDFVFSGGQNPGYGCADA